MNGSSTLIIGRGRAGKTGYALDLVASKSEKFLVLAPQITNPRLSEFDSYSPPIMSGDELREAYNKSEGSLVLIITEKVKDQPSIWKILRETQFNGLVILADELAVLVSDHDDEVEFKIFIRHVGQNNQLFFATSHRIRDDVPPVTPLNVQRIEFVGPLSDEEEIRKLYGVSNVRMSRQEFATKLKNQPLKYNWWDKNPNKTAIFTIFE